MKPFVFGLRKKTDKERIAELEAQLKLQARNLSAKFQLRLEDELNKLHAQIPTIAEARLIHEALWSYKGRLLDLEVRAKVEELLKKMSFLLGESGTDLVAQKTSEKTTKQRIKDVKKIIESIRNDPQAMKDLKILFKEKKEASE